MNKNDVWAEYEIVQPINVLGDSLKPHSVESTTEQPIEQPQSIKPVSFEAKDFKSDLTKEQLANIIVNADAKALMEAVIEGRVIVLSNDVALRYKNSHNDLQRVILPTLSSIADLIDSFLKNGEDISVIIGQYQKIAPTLKTLEGANQMQILMAAPAIISEVYTLAPMLKKLWSSIDFSALKQVDWSAYNIVFERYNINVTGIQTLLKIIEMHQMHQKQMLKLPDGVDDGGLH